MRCRPVCHLLAFPLLTLPSLAFSLLVFPLSAMLQAQLAPPVAPVRPVSDTYFGTVVADPYRWMETSTDELLTYMQGQNAVTVEALQPLHAKDAEILAELTQLSNAVTSTGRPTRILDQFFFLELPSGKSDRVLMTRAVSGGPSRVLLDPATLAEGTKHAAIDYFQPSPDGAFVAVGVSLGGSENSVLHLVDVRLGKLLAEAISRTPHAEPSWTDDSKSFFYSRLQPMAAGAAAATKYDNGRVYLHRLGAAEDSDKAVFGPDVTTELRLPKNGNVAIEVVPGTAMLLGSQVSGVVETPAYWLRRSDAAPWQQVIGHEDGAMDLECHGSRVFVRRKGGGDGAVSNGSIATFDLATETMAAARTVLPESALILSSQSGAGLAAASDALYVYGFREAQGVITRIPYTDGAKATELRLPIEGSVLGLSTDVRRPGFDTSMMGWTVPRLDYVYVPADGTFTDSHLQPPDPANFSAIVSEEVLARGPDGTMVPLSILHRKGLAMDGSHPTLMEAYGAYGIAIPPFFDATLLPWLNRGGVFAIAHVRGGGERGEAWHLAGMKTTKQHTIDDFVTCAHYLLNQHFTSPAHLAIEGTSAGGIAVGGFLTQHPELVGAVLYRVGITDILRSEQRATGGQNAFEYGTVKVEPEFRAMAAINPYTHVKDGTKYPAVLLETGANDPRVTSWMLTKMTARLQVANASANPILLRVDFDAGHGIGSGRTQALKLKADEYTFLGWRLGMPGYEAGRDTARVSQGR